MSNSFARTSRLLSNRRAKGTLSLGSLSLGILSLGILAAWLAWLVLSDVARIEPATSARVEAVTAAHPVEPVAGGLLVAVHARLGQRVEAGDLLVELETEHQDHAIEEARAQLGAWRERLDAARESLRLGQQRAEQERELASLELAEIEAKRQVELTSYEFAAQRVERSERLFTLGLVSEVDLLHHRGDAEKAEAEARVLAAEARSSTASATRDALERAAELTEIEGDIDQAHGEIAALGARIDLLLHEIDDRHLRAPVAGRIGYLASLGAGSVVEVGERVADVVPDDSLGVVAHFPPSAVGKLAIGQNATLRVDALPWTRHGTVALRLERLASEPESETVRGELSIVEGVTLPLAHGMTGRVEVTVERLSPARWLLDAIGGAARPEPTID
ncbi:MAG: HlyD family efflux transporter periplasmic adaptor subunit [Acidobacteriota bacterium]